MPCQATDRYSSSVLQNITSAKRIMDANVQLPPEPAWSNWKRRKMAATQWRFAVSPAIQNDKVQKVEKITRRSCTCLSLSCAMVLITGQRILRTFVPKNQGHGKTCWNYVLYITSAADIKLQREDLNNYVTWGDIPLFLWAAQSINSHLPCHEEYDFAITHSQCNNDNIYWEIWLD